MIRSFLSVDAIDDLTITVAPVVLGAGIPLFGADLPRVDLDLDESRSFPSGMVRLRYAVRR